MIIMQEKLQELIDELKITNAETFYHTIHVKTYVYKMLKVMNADGFTSYSQQEIEFICKGAILHDIGKLFVKNCILTKDSFLTEEERDEMIEHPRLGFNAIEEYLFEDEYEIIKNICLYHHEREDGNGYEQKTNLPVYVQAVAACDVYDALTSDRVYRAGLSRDVALEIISEGKSGYFDKKIINYLKLATE